MQKSSFVVVSFVLFVVAASSARADSVFMTAKAAKQGAIKGGAMQKGHEGAIECLSFTSEVISPRDASSGMATGKRQYKPITCIKRVDQASPLLFNALVNNETLTEVNIRVSGTDKMGKGVDVYSVQLKNAALSGVRQYLDDKGALLEEVTLTFSAITLTWLEGGITGQDSLQPKN